MKKILFFGILVILILGAYLLIKNKVGDLRPALLPSKSLVQKLTQISKQNVGEKVNIPLNLKEGFKIGLFAKDLGGPRDLEFSPGGILLASIPSQGKVVALPDLNNDGTADQVKTILSGLNKPHGLAFFKDKLFITEETRVVRYSFDEKNLEAKQNKVLFNLPSGGRHVTRTITFDDNGRMFVSIGSSCDVCFEKHPWLGAVIVSDSDGNVPKVFAKGLRNAVFIAVNPKTQELWGTEMGRDFLGDDKPPDEINILKEGKDYGWPICWGNKIYDENFNSGKPRSYCGNTQAPIFEIAAHSAPLGLTFINSKQFPQDWQGDLLVSYHGSWNRSTPIGYKVVRLDVSGDKVLNEEDFLTGFLQGGEALGRPVDLVFDKQGNLYLSDDKAGAIYKITSF